MVEIWDSGIPPDAAFHSSMPLYQTTSRSTTLLYGPGEPALLPGKQYAWRVRAIGRAGVEEIPLFKNNGFSEIYTFLHQAPCMAPMSVRITPLPHGRAEVQWAADPQIKAYRVEYRVAGNPANAWFGYDSEGSTYTLTGLQENTAYEVRVGTVCDQARTVFSDPTTFTTLMTRKVDLADCGVRPDIRISNREPMELLRQGDVVMAGDFAVTLLRIQGGNGRFSGIGYVDVPFLGFVRLAVEFTDIEVNTEGQLIGGAIRSVFNAKWEEKDAPTFSEIGKEVKEIGELLFDVAKLTIDRDYADVKKITDAVKDMVRKELPEEFQQSINTATDKIVQASKDYTEARDVYNDKESTKEEKAEAKEKMDKAQEQFKEGQSEFKEAMDNVEKTVKEASKLILAAIKEIRTDKEKEFEQIAVYEIERDALVRTSNQEQGIKEGSATSSGGFVIVGITESTAEDRYSDRKFKDDSAILLKKRKSAHRLALIRAFTDYFNTDSKVSEEFSKDDKIDGKSVVKYVLEQIAKGDSFDKEKEKEVILKIKDMMLKDLDKLADSIEGGN
ncbi:fibronectin type III domain-containing protein [Sphingobacterium luzhongxinii]|uniref:fibronectin type III domain-containing protein n=1 Tax=Sphingobacterium luzhongxinii TaxID=2654181 RepID=UPI0013DC0EA2|nr:fibronectin type III domain-containing protein [Sphingobacterium sp. xlx-73]